MQGAITPNFRMVVLSRDGSCWVIRFYLEKDVLDDVDEIEDIMCQYTAYQNADLKCRSEILVESDDLPESLATDRVVYRRKE